MNQSILLSKWSVLMAVLFLSGWGGIGCGTFPSRAMAAESEEIGWFNPETGYAAGNAMGNAMGNAAGQRSAGSPIRSMELRLANPETENRVRPASNLEAVPSSKPKSVKRPERLAARTNDAPDEELTWFPEENAHFPSSEFQPNGGGLNETRAVADVNKATAEILPPSAVRHVSTENEASQSGPDERSASPTSEPAQLPDGSAFEIESVFEEITRAPDERNRVQNGRPGNGRETEPAPPNSPALKQAETPIDRFGNIGRLENVYARRTLEGGLVGNPYADGVFEYHPRSFAVDPTLQTRTRETPPCESFGQDAYGNNCVACGEYYCDGMCCDYCYDGCDGSCCGGCGGCGGYYDACGYGCGGCRGFFSCLWSSLYPAVRHGEISAGVFGYQDPFTVGSNSNFGVDLGLNWTMPKQIFGLIGQAGARYTRSGRENAVDEGGEDYHRSQFFWTSGLFYRHPGERWQFGGVYDSLRDDANWTYTVGQVRTELSCRLSEETTVGFRGAFHMDEELLNIVFRDKDYSRSVSVQSYYTGFIRHTFVTGAEGTVSAGMTEESEVLVGGRLEVPVTNHSCLRNSFVYVFPKDKSKGDPMSDTWSASISWVVYLGGNSRFGLVNPFKPLFDVADNTTLIQKAK